MHTMLHHKPYCNGNWLEEVLILEAERPARRLLLGKGAGSNKLGKNFKLGIISFINVMKTNRKDPPDCQLGHCVRMVLRTFVSNSLCFCLK